MYYINLLSRFNLIQLYSVFTIIWQRQFKHISFENRTPLPLKNTYDFIVVGAGSAGAIVGCRLSNNGKDVLLIEAGGAQDAILTDHPGLFIPSLLNGGERIWNYTNEPQIVGQAFKAIPEQKGRVLGGSSTVNFMMYQRGNARDYDQLAQETGDSVWSYDNVLPVFKMTERNTDPTVSDQFHGRDGPLGVSTSKVYSPILELMLRVANEHGYATFDVNGVNQTGTTITQSTFAKGIRTSTSNAFIESGLCPKLTIVTKALITKILFKFGDDGVPNAYGVLFEKFGLTHKVFANKEIILSAGPISSPQVLMLSGVGPAQHLQSFSIPVVKDLPIGDNLCNHVALINLAILNDSSLVGQPPKLDIEQLYDADVQGAGPLSQAALSIWYRTSSSRSETDSDYPDHAIYSTPVWKGSPSVLKVFQFKDQTSWNPYLQDLMQDNYLNFIGCLTRPRSRGTIRLRSTSSYDPPLIDPQFLRNPIDMKDMIEMVTFTFKLMENSSLAKVSYINPTPIPGCEYCRDRPVSECESYIQCYTNQFSISLYHPVGTCRMGDPNDARTVVDSRLRVKGIRNLRVADSSVFPHCINTNTNAAAMLVGEMAARFILQDYN